MRNSEHISKKIAAEGWKDMRARLDREMPVSEPQRRPFWLWLFGLGLFAGLAFFVFDGQSEAVLHQNSIVPILPAPKQELPKQSAKEKPIAGVQSINAPLQPVRTKGNSVLENTNSPSSNAKDELQINTFEAHPKTSNQPIEPKSLPHRMVGAAMDGYISENTTPQTIDRNQDVQVVDYQGDEYGGAQEKTPLADVEPLIGLVSQQPLKPLPSTRINAIRTTTASVEMAAPNVDEITLPAKARAAHKLQFGAGIAATYGAITTRGNTWSLGMEGDLRFGSRLALGSNIAYRQRQYRQSSEQFLYVSEDDLEQASGLDRASLQNLTLNYASSEHVAFQVNYINSFEFGLHPSFRFWKNAWLEARLSAIRTSSIGTFEQKSLTDLRTDAVSSTVKRSFTEWDMLYGGALHYRFNENIDMSLRFQKIYQPHNLDFESVASSNATVKPGGQKLPLIAQPLFMEMGIAYRFAL